MPSIARTELISASEKDTEQLITVTKRLSDEGNLQEIVSECSKRQLDDLWDAVLQVCMSTVLNSDAEDKDVKETGQVLGCVSTLASATVAYIVRAREEQQDVIVPHSLQETVIILHGVLPSIAQELGSLKNSLSKLFEDWWVAELPCSEEVMGNTIIYLLTKSTEQKSTQKDVARVWSVHKVLSAIDLGAESSATLVSLLLRCFDHHQFVTTAPGLKFLVHLFTLDPRLIEQLHQGVKNTLHATPKSWHAKYGEIYFRAWQKTADDIRLKIERDCIQDLMYRAVHAQRAGGENSTASILFRVLTYFHKQKNQRGVDSMLTQLYEPILWRCLMVANSDVRVNAATLMFDVFPLQNPGLNVEEADKILQRQFDVMHGLLTDSVVEVRLVAVKGVGRILNLYWELIPVQVIQCLVTCLVQDLAYDVSSPAIREAVIRVMHKLCDNHLCIPMLKKVLPELRNFVHDTSEKVRVAMFDLLLKVKGLRAVKFWHVVPVEHVLARLELDSPVIARKIMKLICPSFVPLDKPPAEQLERGLTLIKNNPGAARQFYLHLPQHIAVQDCVKYITILCRYALETVRQLQQAANDSSNPDESVRDSNTSKNSSSVQAGDEATHSKRARVPRSKRKAQANESKGEPETRTEQKNDEGEGSSGEEASTTATLTGVVEAMYLMFISISEKLKSQEEQAMKEGLLKKLSITVREMINFSQDSGLDTALVALAGHLPSRALPLVSQNLVNRLKDTTSLTGSRSVNSTVILKSLVLWGQVDSVLEIIKDSFDKVLASEAAGGEQSVPSDKTDQAKKKKKKKTVGFAVETATVEPAVAIRWLLDMMTHVECQPVLVKKNKEGLMSVIRSMQPVLERLRQHLTGDEEESVGAGEMDVLVNIFTTYLRLLGFVCVHGGASDGNETTEEGSVSLSANVRKLLHGVLSWTSEIVLDKFGDPAKGATRLKASQQLIEATLNVCRCLLMVNTHTAQFLDQVIEICMTLSQPQVPCLPNVMFCMLACMYQVTQVSYHQQSESQQSQDDSDTQQQRKRMSNIASSCLSKILASLAQHVIDEDAKPVLNSGDKQFVSAFNDLFHELTKPGKEIEDVEVLHRSVLNCVLQELAKHSKQEMLGEEHDLPILCSALLSAVKKRSSNRRIFIGILEKELDGRDSWNIHLIHAVVAVVSIYKKYDGNLVPRSLTRSLRQLLAQTTPGGMDEDVFRDVKKQVEEKVKLWDQPVENL